MVRRILPLSLLSAALAFCIAGTASVARAEDAAKGSVSGKVANAQGEAVKTAKVYILKPDDAPATSRPAGGGGQAGGGARPNYDEKAVAKGDVTDGAYKVADVPAGKYVLLVIATGQGGGRGRADVEVTAGKDTAVPEIKFQARRPRNGGAAPAAN